MNNDQCTVFLKESLRKAHFDSFSAVSEAPEACELAFCAEFNAVSISTLQKFLKKCKKSADLKNLYYPFWVRAGGPSAREGRARARARARAR